MGADKLALRKCVSFFFGKDNDASAPKLLKWECGVMLHYAECSGVFIVRGGQLATNSPSSRSKDAISISSIWRPRVDCMPAGREITHGS